MVLASSGYLSSVKKKKPAYNSEPGYGPPRYLITMWVEKRVPGLYLTFQLPENAFGKESVGWEVVSATYGPPHHLNGRARTVNKTRCQLSRPCRRRGCFPWLPEDCNTPIQAPRSTQPGDEEGNAHSSNKGFYSVHRRKLSAFRRLRSLRPPRGSATNTSQTLNSRTPSHGYWSVKGSSPWTADGL